MWSVWFVFCGCSFPSVCPLMDKDKRLMEASWWERGENWVLRGKLGLVLMGRAMLNKSLIQFSVDGWCCILSFLFDLRPNYGGGNEDNGDLLQKIPCMHCLHTFAQHCSRALEKEMATHSSVLAWRIPGMGEPCGLPSKGSHRVGHDWSDLAAAAATAGHCRPKPPSETPGHSRASWGQSLVRSLLLSPGS